MREALAILLSTASAAATPAAIFALYVYSLPPGRPGTVFVAFCLGFMLASGHVLILGLPVALALVHRKAFRPLPMLIAGGVVGLLPAGFLLLPYTAPRDWQHYSILVGAAMGMGASGGIAFHATHRIIDPGHPPDARPLRGSG